MYDWACKYHVNFNNCVLQAILPSWNLQEIFQTWTYLVSFLQRSGIMGQLESQRCCNFLNPGCWGYFPRSLSFIKPWWNIPIQQKKNIYSVFDKILLTDQEKKIVRKHEADKDAQKVYAKLSTLAVKHTKDLLNSSELLTYITPARLGNGYYTSTTGSFIINFNDQNRIYETLVDISDHLSGVQKRTMLENIVGPIPYLKYAKNQSDQSKKM